MMQDNDPLTTDMTSLTAKFLSSLTARFKPLKVNFQFRSHPNTILGT